MKSLYWLGGDVIAVVANGTEGDGILEGDVLVIDPETLNISAVARSLPSSTDRGDT